MLPGWQLWQTVSTSAKGEAAAGRGPGVRTGSPCLPVSTDSILRSWPFCCSGSASLRPRSCSRRHCKSNWTGGETLAVACSHTDGLFCAQRQRWCDSPSLPLPPYVCACDAAPCPSRQEPEPNSTRHTQRQNTPSRRATLQQDPPPTVILQRASQPVQEKKASI